MIFDGDIEIDLDVDLDVMLTLMLNLMLTLMMNLMMNLMNLMLFSMLSIGGKSQKCFWEPDHRFKDFLRKCVYLQAK